MTGPARYLTPNVRDPRATYDQSLKVLKIIKELDPTIYTKSSIMVGLGETLPEIEATMDDLRSVGVELLTVGQYLQPTTKHLSVTHFVHPEMFKQIEQIGLNKGFMYVASGPVAAFIHRHPTTRMLALAFLLMIGLALVADGAGFHIPRGYIYFAMAFAAAVEVFNIVAGRNRRMRRKAGG
jgi:hypothetical protein